MKVVIVARNLPPAHGGAGNKAATFAPALAQAGHTVVVLTDTPSPAPLHGCTVVSPYRHPGPSSSSLIRRFVEFPWLWFQIGLHRPTLVHTFGAYPFNLCAAWAGQTYGSLTTVGTTLVGADDMRTIRRRRLGRYQARIVRRASKVIDISAALQQISLSEQLPQERLAIIPNPVDEKRFSPEEPKSRTEARASLSLPKERFIAISVGAATHRKGFDRVVEGWLPFAKEHPECHLYLLGPTNRTQDDRTYFLGLNSAVREAGLESSVHWCGQVANVEVYMRAADVFLFGSRREGFGTVYTEAMASGLPVVTFPLPGITDYIFGDPPAVPVVKSASQLTDVLGWLHAYPEFREQLGRSLKERYEDRFSLDVIVNNYLSVWSSLAHTRAMAAQETRRPRGF